MTTIKHIIYNRNLHRCLLTHWGRVTHLCVSKLTSIASDNGLSPGRRQAIIWNNAGILLIGPLWTNFSEILIEIHTFSLKKIRLKLSSVKRRPFSLGLNELKEAPGSRILRPLPIGVCCFPGCCRWNASYGYRLFRRLNGLDLFRRMIESTWVNKDF